MKRILLMLLLLVTLAYPQGYVRYHEDASTTTTITGDSVQKYIYDNAFLWLKGSGGLGYDVVDTTWWYNDVARNDTSTWNFRRPTSAEVGQGDPKVIPDANGIGKWAYYFDVVAGAGDGMISGGKSNSTTLKPFDDAYDADSTTSFFGVIYPITHEDSRGVIIGCFNRAVNSYGMGVTWANAATLSSTTDSLEIRWLENNSGISDFAACSANAWHYFFASAGPTGSIIRVDGVEHTSSTARDGFSGYENDLGIGRGLVSTDGVEFDGYIAELIVLFGDPLTSAEITDIETYLKNKYGL